MHTKLLKIGGHSNIPPSSTVPICHSCTLWESSASVSAAETAAFDAFDNSGALAAIKSLIACSRACLICARAAVNSADRSSKRACRSDSRPVALTFCSGVGSGLVSVVQRSASAHQRGISRRPPGPNRLLRHEGVLHAGVMINGHRGEIIRESGVSVLFAQSQHSVTGMRQLEQFSLRWEHVDLEHGVLTLPTTKAGGVQYVRPNEEAKALLRSLDSWQFSVWVFPSENPATHAIPGTSTGATICRPSRSWG